MIRNVLVIDIGSHKAEEVKLFNGKPNLSPRNVFRLLRNAGFNVRRAASEIKSIRRLSEEFARKFKVRYALVEPIMHKELLDFVGTTRTAFLINGVASCGRNEEAKLLMARKSLGHSIVPEKPGLNGSSISTYNVNFGGLYQFLIETFVISEDCDRVILRMNAEGVEGPIIEYLVAEATVRPNLLAGSLGDIKKCFGQQAYDEAIHKLETSNIPYIYLTSSPATWANGLAQTMAALS